MSGFDNLRRTDEYIGQIQLGYDRERYASDRSAANLISQIPGQILQARQVESDLRLQENEIEFQAHRNKLQMMLELDMVDRSREEVKSLKLANEQGAWEFDQKRKQTSDDYISREFGRKAFMNADPVKLAEAGYVLGERGPVKDEAGAKRVLENHAKYGRSQGSNEFRLSAGEARRRIDSIRAKYTKGLLGFDPSAVTPEDAEMLRRLEAISNSWTNSVYGETGSGQGVDPGAAYENQGYGGGPPPTVPNANPPKGLGAADEEIQIPENLQKLGGIANYVATQRFGDSWTKIDEPSRMAMSLAMGKSIEAIVRKKPNFPVEQAATLVMQQFQEGGMITAYFLRAGNYSDEQIRRYLYGLGREEEAINAIMGRLDDYWKTMNRQ